MKLVQPIIIFIIINGAYKLEDKFSLLCEES